jgi:hypothetical protein
MAKRSPKRSVQSRVDRWADLMKRIIKNPEIADRIPNHANLLFGDGDLIFVNGEPRPYSELVKPHRARSATRSQRKQLA